MVGKLAGSKICDRCCNVQLVTRRILRGTIPRPLLFNVFISDLAASTEVTLNKFTDYTNLRDAVDKQGDRAANQKNLDRSQKGTDRNCIKFNKAQRVQSPAMWTEG